jgi:hypothetical protein
MIMPDSGIRLHYVLKGYNKKGALRQIHLQKGDTIEITNDGYYESEIGWCILIIINEKAKLYVPLTDLEDYLLQKDLLSLVDLQIKLSLWQTQVNHALEQRNEAWFKFVARKISSLQEGMAQNK